MRTLTRVFKALSDETRLQMVALLLQEGELCVCDFVDVLGVTQSKASRHLRHLVNAGLLDDRRDGTWVYFRLVAKPEPAQAHVVGLLPAMLTDRIAPELLDRLRDWQTAKACTGASCGDLLAERASKRRA
jgi:ArsR family transcriptional regulator